MKLSRIEKEMGGLTARFPSLKSGHLQSVLVSLAGADADDLIHVLDEDLSVADVAGAGGVDDQGADGFDFVVADDHVEGDLREEVDVIFGPSVDLLVAFLAPEPLGLVDRHALESLALQRVTDHVEPVRLDDGAD